MATTATVNGGQILFYHDYGGDGPVVVLLHSFLMDHTMFAPQIAELGASFRLIGVDERGFGGTPATRPFGFWDVAQDILGLLDVLNIGRAAVVGVSQGGFIAMRMALLAPERITTLCLLGTSAASEPPETAAAYRAIVADWKANGPEKHVDMVATLSMGDFDAKQIKARWLTLDRDQLVTSMEALVTRASLLPRLGEIRCPTLVLHGTADSAYEMRRAEEIAEGIKTAKPVVAIEGGAHYLSLTHPEYVNPHLRRFLSAQAC
jgi:pimeloyl-ACP methyl ester carboxylesterase